MSFSVSVSDSDTRQPAPYTYTHTYYNTNTHTLTQVPNGSMQEQLFCCDTQHTLHITSDIQQLLTQKLMDHNDTQIPLLASPNADTLF